MKECALFTSTMQYKTQKYIVYGTTVLSAFMRAKKLAAKFCGHCDLSAVDDANHLVMQCPSFHEMRKRMFDEIRETPDGPGTLMLDHCDDVYSIHIGRQKEDFTIEQMEKIWMISGKYINIMYGLSLKCRKGVV